MGSNCNFEILPPKLNTPNINTGPPNPVFNIDLSKSFFNTSSGSTELATPLALTKFNNASHHPPHLLKIELANSALNYSTPPPSSSINEQQPSPPVIRNDVCNTPVIKIDYSKIVTAFTPLSSPELNVKTPPPTPLSSIASSSFARTAAGASSSSTAASPIPNHMQLQQKPQTSTSVNIDFSTFNSSLLKTAKTIYPPQPPTQSASSLDMDEDYDNI